MPRSVASIAFVLVPLALATLAAAAGQEKWMGWYFKDFDPAGVESSALVTTDDYKLARNIWSHVTRFYAVLESKEFEQLEDGFTDITLSQNMPATKLPVRSAPAFLANLETAWVNGTTLWLDYSFPAFPENVGHWMEMLLPVYSQLSLGKWKEQLRAGEDLYIGACIFPNLRRGQVQGVPWVVDMVKLALGPGLPPGKELPIVLFYDELEQLNATMWTGFERILYIQDRYTHPTGRNGFATQELGRQFRDAAYRHVNFSRHDTWDQGIPPPTITYLMANGGEQVVNNGDILASLQDLGSALGFRVRPYTVTSQAPFSSYVASMAKTGVLVARHGPLLGNTIFLPPGALVLELLPYNWEWKRISEMYYNMTRSLGDIHHFAWRATSSQWAVYNPPEDVKYSHWTIEECSSKYCLEAHARAGMIADVGSVHEILLDLLPSVMRGEAVDTLRPRRPWPTIKPEGDGHTGLWWDVQ